MSDERARLFVALELPPATRDALVAWRRTAVDGRTGLREVAPEALHATLCFLGWRSTDEVEDIAAACAVLASESTPELSLGEAIWLPERRPRVLAVELIDPQRALAGVQAALSDALRAGGWYAPEARPFLGHITVARVAKGARVRREGLPPPPRLEFRGSTLTLYRSRLGPGGARYEPLRSIELGSVPAPSDAIATVHRFHERQARAYAGGELEELRELLSEDVIWHVPGRSAIAGEHRGIEAVLAYFKRRRRLGDHTFRITIHGASLISGRVVQLAGGTAERGGGTLIWETVGVFRVADGRIAECWLVPFDLYAFDEIWS